MTWIINNIGTIIVVLVLLVACFFAVRTVIRNKKAGKCCSGGCGTGSCESCHGGTCHCDDK